MIHIYFDDISFNFLESQEKENTNILLQLFEWNGIVMNRWTLRNKDISSLFIFALYKE